MAAEHGRLTGWKEIAGFLGKGLRTVQRWERESNLPVHRQGPDGASIFAYCDELEAWVRAGGPHRKGEQAEASSNGGSIRAIAPLSSEANSGLDVPAASQVSQRLRQDDGAANARLTSRVTGPWWFAAGLGIAAVAVALVSLGRGRDASASIPSKPAKWHATSNVLHVTDAVGRGLWTHTFDYDLERRVSSIADELEGSDPVVIEDLDQDGAPEVIVAPPAPVVRSDKGVYVFNAAGTIRFRFEPANRVRFGDSWFAGPWLNLRLFVLRPGDGQRPSLWIVYTHGTNFPSLLVQLSPDGHLMAEYWSNGYIDVVTAAVWRNRLHLFVGATNNETRGASVAIFPFEAVGGAAPAAAHKYRCTSCPDGIGPTEFITFPRRCVSLRLDGQPMVWRLWREGLDRLQVLVAEGHAGPRGSRAAAAWYKMAPDLAVESASYSDGFRAHHLQLERAGELDHSFDAHGHRDLLPAKRWNGAGFEVLPERIPN